MEKLKENILNGNVFIYPTDTVYGLGCDANNKKSVEKIKKIKGRDSKKPLSIIAPTFEWVKDHCIINKNLNLEKYLPGPYTLILKKKNTNLLKHVSSENTIGIRMPDSDFCNKIRIYGVPIITTSVNLSGEKPATQISEINKNIKEKVDFIIDNGKLKGTPSTLIINGKEIKR